MKKCIKCLEVKSLIDFGRDSRRQDGRFPYCKQCRRRASGPSAEFKKLALTGHQRCSKCQTIKPFSAYYSDIQKNNGVTSRCIKCTREIRRLKDLNRTGSVARKEYLFKKGFKECVKCLGVKRIEDFGKDTRNSSGLKARCRKCMCDYYANRLPSKRDYIRNEIFERDDYLCYLCEEIIDMDAQYPDPESPSIDHVVPLSQMGIDEASNVRATHLYCNYAKRDYDLEDYLASKG